MRTDARAVAIHPRWRSAVAAAITIPLGLLTRADVPLPEVVAIYGGDTLYATLIFFLAALLWSHWPMWRGAAVALGFCYVVAHPLARCAAPDATRSTRARRGLSLG